jgi:hypothetical protein
LGILSKGIYGAIYGDCVVSNIKIWVGLPIYNSSKIVKSNNRRTSWSRSINNHRVKDVIWITADWILREFSYSLWGLYGPDYIILVYSWCNYWKSNFFSCLRTGGKYNNNGKCSWQATRGTIGHSRNCSYFNCVRSNIGLSCALCFEIKLRSCVNVS